MARDNGAPPPGGAAERSGCAATTVRGTPCGGFVLPDSGYCFAHDPARRAELLESRAKGAVASNTLRSIRGKRTKLDNAAGLVKFTDTLIHDTLDGTVEKDVARVVLYGVSIQRQLVETGDLEKRIAALEQRRGRSWA